MFEQKTQEELIEKLSNAINRFDGFNVELEYTLDKGHASIWFEVLNMNALDTFCNLVGLKLFNAAFSLVYMFYEKDKYRKFRLDVKCGRPEVFEKVVTALTNRILNITRKENVVWVDFKRKT